MWFWNQPSDSLTRAQEGAPAEAPANDEQPVEEDEDSQENILTQPI